MKDYEPHCEDDLQLLGDDNNPIDDISVNDGGLSKTE